MMPVGDVVGAPAKLSHLPLSGSIPGSSNKKRSPVRPTSASEA